MKGAEWGPELGGEGRARDTVKLQGQQRGQFQDLTVRLMGGVKGALTMGRKQWQGVGQGD